MVQKLYAHSTIYYLPNYRDTTGCARENWLQADRTLDQRGRRIVLGTRGRRRRRHRRRMDGVQKLECAAAAAIPLCGFAQQKRWRMLGTEVLMLVMVAVRHHRLRHVRAASQQTVGMRMHQRCRRDGANDGRLMRHGLRMNDHVARLHDEMLAGTRRWAARRHHCTDAGTGVKRMMMMVLVAEMVRLRVWLAAAAGREDAAAAAAAADTAGATANGRAKDREGIVVLGDRYAGHAFDVAQNLRIVMGDLGQLRFVGAVKVGYADQMLVAIAAAATGNHVQTGRGRWHLHGSPLHLFRVC